MCCTMCTLSSVVSYAEIPDEVAKTKPPIPAPTHARVRPIGHRSPLLWRTATPLRYKPVTQTLPLNRHGSRPHPAHPLAPVNPGRPGTTTLEGRAAENRHRRT